MLAKQFFPARCTHQRAAEERDATTDSKSEYLLNPILLCHVSGWPVRRHCSDHYMVSWSKSRRWFRTQLDKLTRLNEIRTESLGELRTVDPLLHVKEELGLDRSHNKERPFSFA